MGESWGCMDGWVLGLYRMGESSGGVDGRVLGAVLNG